MVKPTPDVKIFLMDMKRLYQYAVPNTKTPSSQFQDRLTIHFLHYVVEQVLREKARDHQFSVPLSDVGFEKIIKKLNRAKNIPNFDRLLELNTMRNNAEHQNIIASKEDVAFQVKIVEDFLKWSFKEYFKTDYDSLRLEDFIEDTEIRDRMIKATDFIKAGDFKSACDKMNEAIAIFKSKLFSFFVDPKLWNIPIGGLRLTDVLTDLTLKIFFSNDLYTLTKLTNLPVEYIVKDGQTQVTWNVQYIVYGNEIETRKEYDAILNIILSYQNRVSFQK